MAAQFCAIPRDHHCGSSSVMISSCSGLSILSLLLRRGQGDRNVWGLFPIVRGCETKCSELCKCLFAIAICDSDHESQVTSDLSRSVPPCVATTCAERPVFAWVVGELWAADPSKCTRAHEANASSGTKSEAPRCCWKSARQQHPAPESQDSQHMLKQPRGSFPD